MAEITAVTRDAGRAPLLHNTAEPLGELRVTKQRDAMKPFGLWYGVGEAWLEWCRNEMPMWEHKHTYEIVLHPQARVLRLRSVAKLKAFDREFSVGTRYDNPNWAKVATRYDGIEIAPYQWSLRLGWRLWYYGWDCASGCIWNPRAIATVEKK